MMTYEDGGCVDSGEDSESGNANDVVVEQRGTGLISRDGILQLEIPVTGHGD
jgi:hypothetical protein